jgi:hypothetical protein
VYADCQERQQCPDSDMTAAFDRAQDLGAMFTGASTSFVEVFVTRLAQQHRLLTAEGISGKPAQSSVDHYAHTKTSLRS